MKPLLRVAIDCNLSTCLFARSAGSRVLGPRRSVVRSVSAAVGLSAARGPIWAISWALAAGLLAACNYGGDSVRRPPNIVLVTVDALRPDHTSLYSYERDTTPFLAELARTGVVFETAYASASWTAPSMASLFTSLPARSHGVLDGFLTKAGPNARHDMLSADFVTLAEFLKSKGYRTFGVSTNGHLSQATGFAQGFDHFLEDSWKDSDRANEMARSFAAELRGGGPYFLWIHYFDPHSRYRARSPWIERYSESKRDQQRWAGLSMPELERRVSIFKRDEAARAAVMRLYDSEIAAVDSAMRELFEELGIDDGDMLVLSADHGEAFVEHGRMGHGGDLFEEQVRIPLLFRLPGGRRSGRSRVPASIVDVYPTIAAAAGFEIPEGLSGADLFSMSGLNSSQRVIALELDRGGRSRRALRKGKWKFHMNLRPVAQPRLYDLGADPAEKHDLSGDESEIMAAMRQEWDAWEGAHTLFEAPHVSITVSKQQAEQLRALGYAH